MITDEEIILGCINKSTAARQSLYIKYSERLKEYCKNLCKNDAAADDLLHDSFIHIYENIDSFSHRGAFLGWMIRIIRYTYLSDEKIKHRKRNIFIEEDEYKNSYLDIPVWIILETLEGFSNEQKNVFILFYFKNLTHKQIATRLQIKEETSKSHLFRTKEKMKKTLIKKFDL